MNINKNNYEAFFLDYYEGNLTPQQVADMLLFIEQHPEFKDEFESFENITFEDNSLISFEGKSELKKEITIDNKDEYFIKSVENVLTPAENTLLNNFIKQHPQYLPELELFQKVKLSPDNGIIFENKEALKQISVSTDDLIIASVEGLLTPAEEKTLNKKVAADSKLKNDLLLFKQTKLVADTSIIFENKESLKQKNRKVVPLFYYVAIAASILLLFGLFSIYNTTSTEQKLANTSSSEILHSTKDQSPKISDQDNNIIKPEKKSTDPINSLAEKSSVKKKADVINKKDLLNSSVVNETVIAHNEEKNTNELPTTKEELPIVKVEQSNKQIVSSGQQQIPNNKQQSNEFLSLREIAASKIKEKTLDADVIESEKKNGKLKKFSGWDVVQIIAKGASKITGKKVEAKPTYNEEGEVTAYALGAGGFEFSRGK